MIPADSQVDRLGDLKRASDRDQSWYIDNFTTDLCEEKKESGYLLTNELAR